MATTTYYVALAFTRSEDDGRIVACEPKEARSADQAIRMADVITVSFHPHIRTRAGMKVLARDLPAGLGQLDDEGTQAGHMAGCSVRGWERQLGCLRAVGTLLRDRPFGAYGIGRPSLIVGVYRSCSRFD